MFLRVDENKTELFEFLAQCIAELQVDGKQIVTTFKNSVLCNQGFQQSNFSPCYTKKLTLESFSILLMQLNQGMIEF